MIVSLLSEHDYLGPLAVVPDGIGHTHIARLRTPHHPAEQVFACTYPQRTHPRSLVNEITGYLIAAALSLPRPAHAYLVPAPLGVLLKLHPHLEVDDVFNGLFPVWCTSAIEGKTPKYHFRAVDDPRFLEDLMGWECFADAAAFDEWAANVDRNWGNLVRRGKHDYVLIDHEDLCTGRAWLGDLLCPDDAYRNILEFFAHRAGKHHTNSGMLHASRLHAPSLLKVLRELLYWWKIFLPPDEFDAVRRFVITRAYRSESLIRKRYHLI